MLRILYFYLSEVSSLASVSSSSPFDFPTPASPGRTRRWSPRGPPSAPPPCPSAPSQTGCPGAAPVEGEGVRVEGVEGVEINSDRKKNN